MRRLYPIFKEAAQFTLIPYWQAVFISAAEGKLPRQITISREIVYVNKGTKCYKYEMPSQPEQVLTLFKNIFETVLGMKAEQEQDVNDYNKYQEQNCLNNMEKEITKIKDVRKKEDRLKLIYDYVLQLGNKLNMNLKQKQRLKFAILTGLDLKIIKDIDFDDSKIINIKGLYVKKGKKGFVIKLQH